MSHLVSMLLYALLVSTFFALLWRDKLGPRGRLFLQLFIGMVFGGLAIAWLMYFLPSGPPIPFPEPSS